MRESLQILTGRMPSGLQRGCASCGQWLVLDQSDVAQGERLRSWPSNRDRAR